MTNDPYPISPDDLHLDFHDERSEGVHLIEQGERYKITAALHIRDEKTFWSIKEWELHDKHWKFVSLMSITPSRVESLFKLQNDDCARD